MLSGQAVPVCVTPWQQGSRAEEEEEEEEEGISSPVSSRLQQIQSGVI